MNRVTRKGKQGGFRGRRFTLLSLPNPPNFTRRYHSELVYCTILLERKEKRRGQIVVLPASSLSHQPVGEKNATESTFARASAVAEVADSLFDVENQKSNQGDCEGSRLAAGDCGLSPALLSEEEIGEGPLEQGKKDTRMCILVLLACSETENESGVQSSADFLEATIQ